MRIDKGHSLQSLNRHGEALECFDQAMRLGSKGATIYHGKGVSLQSLNRHGEALACFEEAIRLDPEHAEARKSREDVLDFLRANR